jgi:nitrate reductase alpha subunit
MAERSSPLLEVHRFLRRGPVNEEGWSQLVAKGRDWERSYRGRWAHDKVVRSTHRVNCTGSCSWQVFVKDGLITWESQAVDYPSTGPEMPEYEPARLPAGRVFLLVHLLATAAALPVRARQPARDVPRGQEEAWRSGRRVGRESVRR